MVSAAAGKDLLIGRDPMLDGAPNDSGRDHGNEVRARNVDAYFSADVETDGPIPWSSSILSFAIVYAGHFDGDLF